MEALSGLDRCLCLGCSDLLLGSGVRSLVWGYAYGCDVFAGEGTSEARPHAPIDAHKATAGPLSIHI